MNFSDKAVLVTGGTRGIGRATVDAFLAHGARVAVNGRSLDSVQKFLASTGHSERIVAAPGDISTVTGCRAAVDAAIETFGGLDVLVNSAGVYDEISIEDSDEAFWSATIDTNLKGTFFCCKAALAALRESKGNIVNIASESGLMGNNGCAVYCASKGGVINMTRAMALEIAPDVRINCVCPGFVDTEMVRNVAAASGDANTFMKNADLHAPMKRICTPQEIASAVLYLASGAAGFVTGAALAIDGGATAGY